MRRDRGELSMLVIRMILSFSVTLETKSADRWTVRLCRKIDYMFVHMFDGGYADKEIVGKAFATPGYSFYRVFHLLLRYDASGSPYEKAFNRKADRREGVGKRIARSHTKAQKIRLFPI